MNRHAISRRRYLVGTTLAGAGWGVASSVSRSSRAAAAPIVLGVGRHSYEWVSSWAPLPSGKDYGNTHGGIVIDATERVYFSNDTTDAVLMFDTDGRFLGSWGSEFAAGLHGMCIVQQCDEEVLYLAHTGRHQVIKTSLDGKTLAILPFPEKSGVYSSLDQYQPTAVAVGPNGNIYVADGYGKGWVHQFGPTGDYIRSWGGPGSAPGQFQTPHGIFLDTRKNPMTLVVADRENARLQLFDLDGKLIGMVSGMLKRPCGGFVQGDDVVIPDLDGRVTLLDKDNKLITHLGENPNPQLRANNGVDHNQWQDGLFLAPHSARWDDDGNLYVMDWNFRGRVTKLRRIT